MVEVSGFKLLKAAAVAGVISLAAAGAQAAPVVVTINPSAAGISTQGAFNADSYTLSDFATISQNNALGTFTESGVLQFESFKLGATTLANSTTGLRNGVGGGSTYGLYITFTAQGVITGPAGGEQLGNFTNISYTLLADPGNQDTINQATNTLVNGGTPDIVLATGSLGAAALRGPQNQVNLSFGVPSANVLLTLIKQNPAGNQFFAAPPNLGFQEDSFTNNSQQATVSTVGDITTVIITAGGGSGTFATVNTPEPASLAVLGVGLLGLGLVRRRNRS